MTFLHLKIFSCQWPNLNFLELKGKCVMSLPATKGFAVFLIFLSVPCFHWRHFKSTFCQFLASSNAFPALIMCFLCLFACCIGCLCLFDWLAVYWPAFYKDREFSKRCLSIMMLVGVQLHIMYDVTSPSGASSKSETPRSRRCILKGRGKDYQA